MPDTGGQTFYTQHLAVDGHDLPWYLLKWGQQFITFFAHRVDMVDWFTRVKEDCLSRKVPSMPLEIVYRGQRCGFYADIECLTPPKMSTVDVDTLKAEIKTSSTTHTNRGGWTAVHSCGAKTIGATRYPSTSSDGM